MRLRASPDAWGTLYPRRWQAECLGILLKHFSAHQPTPAAIQAIMGSGKSKLLAQFLQHCELDGNEAIVVSTSSIYLVEQLLATFRDRLENDFGAAGRRVGAYYTKSKDMHQPIIVTCTPSVPELALSLQRLNRPVAFWFGDECHRTACSTIMGAQQSLKPARILGMSATCHRASDEERLTLFQKLLYRYGAAEAIADGKVVVPWRIIPWSGGDTTLDDACIQMTHLAIGPGVFSALNIEDAEAFAKKLTQAGITAEAVHCKLSSGAIKQRLSDLKNGVLRAVVHVAMLQEGVDFPWLRWLCLRRPVTSRVRFAQEVGRTLRYYQDPVTGSEKTEAILYDPHGLFELLKLEYKAVLGGDYAVDEPDEPEDENGAAAIDKELQQAMKSLLFHLSDAISHQNPISVEPLAAYLTELVCAMDVCHLLPEERRIAGRSWRRLSPTPKQLSTINNMTWVLDKRKCVPSDHKDVLEILSKHGTAMNRGVASDLITVFKSLADVRKWPDLKHLDAAARESMKKHVDKQATRQTFINPLAPRPASEPPPAQGYLFEGVANAHKKRS